MVTRGVRKALLLVASLFLLTAVLTGACGSGDGSDQIHGTWHWDVSNVYLTLDADGEWSGRIGLDGDRFDWGAYTFVDGVLALSGAEDSYCPGATAIWNGSFQENGDELHLAFVSDSCTKASQRGVDQIFTRYTP